MPKNGNKNTEGNVIPTLAEYITAQIANKRAAALDKSRNRTSIRVPMIPNQISEDVWRDRLMKDIESSEEFLSRAMAEGNTRGANFWKKDLDNLLKQEELGYPVIVQGSNCMYNAGDCYGLNIPGNLTFAAKHRKLGFQKAPKGSMEPGDIVQDVSSGKPLHAMIYDSKDSEGNLLFNYARGSIGDNAFDMNKNYAKQSKYIIPIEDYDVYKFVGTQADSTQWTNEYKQIYGNQMKCGGRRKAQLGLDIREGGIAIPIAPNMYYMNGRSHDEGGIGIGPNNKNGLEVEGGEVVKVGDKDIKVFSSVPLLRGVSPAQLVMGGANPNKVFKAQEEFKDRNHINDDGTRYENGGNKFIKYENLPSTFKGKRVNGRILQGGVPPVLSRGEFAMGNPLQRMSMWSDDLGEFSKYMARRIHKFVPKKVDTAYRYVVDYLSNKGPNNAIDNNAENLTKAVSLFNAHEYKTGGIYIKPSKRGTFTAAAKKRGMGVQEFASKVLANKEDYSPAMVKKANFARNASRWKKELGGNMIYTVNGNVKNGLMSARPKAVLGKQRKVEGYGNTIVVGDDTFMLNEDGVYVPVGNVQIDKQSKIIRGASGSRDIVYDRQGNRYQRRSDGSLIRISPEKGNIVVSDTIRGVEVNAKNLTTLKNRRDIYWASDQEWNRNADDNYPEGSISEFIKSNTTVPKYVKKANPPRQKVEPDFEIGDQSVVNFLRNDNGRYNTQRTPIHSFTPAQKLGLSSYGWSTYNDPNKGYSFKEDAAAVRAGQKSLDEIISQDLSQINFDDNQSSSIPRRRGTKSSSSKAATKSTPTLQDTVNQITRDAIYRSNTPKIDLSKAKMPTFDVSQLGSKERRTYKANTPKSGRWIGQYKSNNVGDWIGLGSNLAGTVASYFMTKNAINKMPDPIKPVMAQAAKLKTRYNVEPQLTGIREAEQMNRAAVRRNTQSSSTSLAREQRLLNEARGAKNVLYGRKENIETQLINQDRLNRQTVMMENVNRYNDYLNRLTGTRQAKNQLRISNINNLLSGLTGSVNNILGTIESRRATNNTLRAIAAANPNVDARLIGGFDYYIDPVTKRKYNKNQQYVGTING